MRTLIIYVIFVAFIAESNACTCPPQHPQEHFCKSQFVVQARVISQRTVNNGLDIVYTVQIIQDFKSDRRRYGQQTTMRTIKTSSSSAACGSYFKINKEYIISGFNNQGKWETNLCAWNTETSLLTEYQRRALNFGIYQNSCTCKIFDCTSDVIDCPAVKGNECVIRTNPSCYYDDNSCGRVNSKCMWASPSCDVPQQ
ncbi:metalloproteinase inhibitor 3-like [Saccostrea cucullata]|uniref:metalloproteinase inhibitor 3-like n=1 Tax=Saccostrea cuccullata TaxID=36930 RepID=UPI002ED54252